MAEKFGHVALKTTPNTIYFGRRKKCHHIEKILPYIVNLPQEILEIID